MGIYDFKVKAMDGRKISLSAYEGKVLLIINSATGCGFTPQYDALEELYEQHNKDGFEILDFPCNQFGQAPGSDGEIHEFCVWRYGVSFPQFAKIDVNGRKASPLYRYLTENTSFSGFEGPEGELLAETVSKIDPDYASNDGIKWNFTKFLIGRDGGIVARFEPTVPIGEVRARIEEIL